MILENLPSEQFLQEKEKVGGVHSITQFVECFKDSITGKKYFVKSDPDGVEFRRYKVMYDADITDIPSEIFFLDDHQHLATHAMGQPFQERIQNEKSFDDLLRSAATLIKHFHDKIINVSYIDDDLVSVRNSHTSHPVFNFNSRFVNGNSTASNAFLNASMADLSNLDLSKDNKENIEQIYTYVLKIVEKYQKKVNGVVDDCHEDKEIALGDFKPENTIVDEQDRLLLIDPSFVKGNTIFDTTKFVSRLLLEGVSPTHVLQFLEFYDGKHDTSMPVYRGFSRKELINMDMVNILSSYLGRFLLEKNDYRLVNKLNSISSVLPKWESV